MAFVCKEGFSESVPQREIFVRARLFTLKNEGQPFHKARRANAALQFAGKRLGCVRARLFTLKNEGQPFRKARRANAALQFAGKRLGCVRARFQPCRKP